MGNVGAGDAGNAGARDAGAGGAGNTDGGGDAGAEGAWASCLLLRHGDQNFAFFRDRETGIMQQAPQEVSHEVLVKKYVFADSETPLVKPPATFDNEVAEAVREWASRHDMDPDDITIVASKYLERQAVRAA